MFSILEVIRHSAKDMESGKNAIGQIELKYFANQSSKFGEKISIDIRGGMKKRSLFILNFLPKRPELEVFPL